MIQAKPKICSVCGQLKPLYRSTPKTCYSCRERKPIAKKAYKLLTISKSRQEALKRYRRLRDKYFEEHPVCEFPGCNSTKITLHHKRGRVGAFLTDKRHFCSLCFKHHRWVEENPLEARKMGLSEKRLTA
jgi:hypothetical protein